MEKRVAGIIRWLERCVKAYKSGAVESALMDAECARADIETLRCDLWKKLEGCPDTRARRFNSVKAAEALLWAVGITLITATPLALQQERLTRENRAGVNVTLEWVTADERELLSNVRRRPEETVALVVSDVPIVEPQVLPAHAAEPVRRRNPEPPPLRSEPQQREQIAPEMHLPYDRILSLIETGERAMKNDSPAIRVESAIGR